MSQCFDPRRGRIAIVRLRTFSGRKGSDSEPAYRMQLADSLEREGLFQGAARQYTTVAEQFPESSYYPSAVRRAALMYSISPIPRE